MSPWIHPGDCGLLWLEGKQDCPCVGSEEERTGPGLECLLTCTRLNDYERRGFALRDGQEPRRPHPAVVEQSAVAEGGTGIHPGDPERERSSRRKRDSEGATKPGSRKPQGLEVLKKPLSLWLPGLLLWSLR